MAFPAGERVPGVSDLTGADLVQDGKRRTNHPNMWSIAGASRDSRLICLNLWHNGMKQPEWKSEFWELTRSQRWIKKKKLIILFGSSLKFQQSNLIFLNRL